MPGRVDLKMTKNETSFKKLLNLNKKTNQATKTNNLKNPHCLVLPNANPLGFFVKY